MSLIPDLARFNAHHLREGLQLVGTITDAAFTGTDDALYTSSVGEHLRHIVEHYQCFLAGHDCGRIDYDGRARDLRISGDRDFAEATIKALISGLDGMEDSDGPVLVKMAVEAREESICWTTSTLCRELQYLQAHTIHHYALISLILKLQGVDVHATFGVAPSTLLHHRAGS